MKKLIFIISSLFISYNVLALEKKDVEEYFQKSFSKVSTIGIDYSDLNNKYNKGYINAKKGNKYRIVSNDRIIVSNGSKIWNYSVKDNKVMISKFDACRSSFSIENLFFDILKNSEIKSFSKEISTSTKQKNLYNVSLSIIDADKNKYKIDNLSIKIDEQKKIKYISFKYNNQLHNIQIKNLSLNKKLKDKDFEFKTPKNCTSINVD